MQRLIRNVSVVVGIAVCLTTVLAAPAAARRRHHRRNHHVACGPDTVFQNGVCVFVDPPVGDPNVVIQPNPIQMTITGHVVGAITFHGLLPFDVLTMNTVSIPDPCGGDCGPPPLGPAGIPCGLNAVLTVTPNPIVADAAGNATAQLFDTTLPPGPGGCVPGIYPLVFLEVKQAEGSAPPRTFTGFVTLFF
ncbi:MAG TPA: hypothetical protein VFA94_06745 [Acidimicrobiales bacterium]|nr:hypothetical protein [Acidimicrobiales bacterium]